MRGFDSLMKVPFFILLVFSYALLKLRGFMNSRMRLYIQKEMLSEILNTHLSLSTEFILNGGRR